MEYSETIEKIVNFLLSQMRGRKSYNIRAPLYSLAEPNDQELILQLLLAGEFIEPAGRGDPFFTLTLKGQTTYYSVRAENRRYFHGG